MVPWIVFALISSLAVTVSFTIGMVLLYDRYLASPYAQVRKEVLQENQTLKEEAVEQEFGRRHPNLLTIKLYAGIIMIGVMGITFAASFFIIQAFNGGK